MMRRLLKAEPDKSRALGMPTAWPVDADYAIQQTRVKGKSTTVLKPLLSESEGPHLYTPASRADLPSALAKLKRGDEAAIIRFARIYGMLGFYELLPEKAKLDHVYGDPLEWIWSHADTLRLCLELKEMLDGERDDLLMKRLSSLTILDMTNRAYPCPFLRFAAGVGTSKTQLFPVSGESRTSEIRNLAAKILETIVNRNISGIFPVMTWVAKRQSFVQFFHCTALVEMAYWHIANVLRGGRVRRCERPGCGGSFIQTDGRQRFCPGEQDGKQESPCAVLARVQRFRRKVRD